MDILFLIGLAWGLSEAWKAYGPKLAQARTNGRARAVKRGGTHNTEGARRRAARQATIGFWAGEVRHGFPTARHGFAAGWGQHQDAMLRGEAERARRRAEQAAEHRRLRDEIAAHRRRLEEARPQPAMSQQLVTDVDAQRRGKTAPPLPADQVQPGGSLRWYSWGPERPRDGEKRPGTRPAEATAGGNGVTTAADDITYDETIQIARDMKAAADTAVDPQALAKARGLGDRLSAVLHNDNTVSAAAVEMSEAAAAVDAANKELMEKADALEKATQQKLGGQQEAVDAAGGTDAQAGYFDH